jgi:hypothetical protein
MNTEIFSKVHTGTSRSKEIGRVIATSTLAMPNPTPLLIPLRVEQLTQESTATPAR